MQRRYFPSILLYGFGLALALSLAFNGFLLYEQSHHRHIYEYDSGGSVYSVDQEVGQELSDCKRDNEEKDSVIRRLEQSPNAPPPTQAGIVQRTDSK